MANTIQYVAIELDSFTGHAHRIQWPAMVNTDEGRVLELAGSADRSVQVSGTFDGATVTIQGTNEACHESTATPTYATLHDPQGAALTITAARIVEIAENVAGMRPVISAGGASTSLTVTICTRRLS